MSSRINKTIRRDKRRREELKQNLVVIAECIGCGNKREIKASAFYTGEIPQGEQPVCDKCFMPMIAKRAEIQEEF